ncbi:MAG: glycerophosphodiester phosphodiesterase [Actinomycetia bacterium]|nr:glycerophosphodiester phosphodiesterase [Actinomycetes bacterium]MCP4960717.1 glycerophosphodiester phosphodiesterase [Actinomycetes bacterium]
MPDLLVVAHRGASNAERENTILAFELAVALGSDAVELDVRRSADGQMIVHHDAHLSDGRLIADTSTADLPDHVPGLAAALDACGKLLVNIEIKNSETEPDHDPDRRLAAQVVDLVVQRGQQDNVLVSSFDLDTVDLVRELNPSIPTALLVFGGEPGELLELCARKGHGAIHPHDTQVDANFMTHARRLDIMVNVWTVDDSARMRELVALGVNGIVTNVPDVARTVVDG